MLVRFFPLFCAFVTVNGLVRSEDTAQSILDKNDSVEEEKKVTTEKYAPTTYKYPTATWSASSYEMKKKEYNPETTKLYLFKPSPFLKPPFTEGEVGASITGIEDGVNVTGRRKGIVRWKQDKMHQTPTSVPPRGPEKTSFVSQKEDSKDSHLADKFLEQALRNYVKSANLTDEYGTISVDAFSEALRRITEGRKNSVPPYDENRELRRKFRDEILSPKKTEVTTSGGLLEKQYQRRLQKTWEVINENISIPSRAAFLDRRSDWQTTELPRNEVLLFEPPLTSTEGIPRWRDAQIVKVEPTTRPVLMIDGEDEDWVITNTPVAKSEVPLSSAEDRWQDGSSNSVEYHAKDSIYNNGNNMLARDLPKTTTSPFIPGDRPTTFRPVVTTKKLRSKTSRGKKKWRDTMSLHEQNSWDDGEVKLSVAETVYYQPRQSPLKTFPQLAGKSEKLK